MSRRQNFFGESPSPALLAVLPAIQAMEQLPVTLGIQSITQFNHVMRGRTQHSISAHRANGELHIEHYWD